MDEGEQDPTLVFGSLKSAKEHAIKVVEVIRAAGCMAVAGFSKEDVEMEVKENTLSIRGEKKEADTERTFLHRGIASRAFERRFQLADHVEVRGADVKDGLLSVDLEREVPERLKPRVIQIGAMATKESNITASVAAN